jgi:hypothetical protein
MPVFQFKDMLTLKYVALIEKYFSKEDIVVVLTSNLQSPVLAYMQKAGYRVALTDKSLVKGRELNAIIDLLISNTCNNVFIGNINPHDFHGSTFSYLIWKRLSENTTKVLVDLDQIKRDEYTILAKAVENDPK